LLVGSQVKPGSKDWVLGLHLYCWSQRDDSLGLSIAPQSSVVFRR